MNVMPFLYCDGIPTLRDSDIMELFDKMVRDNTVEIVFYDGIIDSREKFLSFMKDSSNQLFVVFDGSEKIAFAWINKIEHKTANIHFCMFSEAWHDSIAVGKYAAEKLMSSFGLNMVWGRIPLFNQFGIDFVEKLGAKSMGEVPMACLNKNGKAHPAIFFYFLKEQ